ncbi:MAG: multifunctional CCA tRNA nucleotidyl transferase/2'3'-cyclic phosphodiesterase/2'nucleotidase/phosphatase [Betaproteobacteria bacterium]|nr:MAG: multifunctional CCA tRNA nucleotidyl transferase/2'3'-cyclic phosphodiesterase/2'nucleotidase/phosphatase [Betaproteobacteria bacterium]
MKAYVVGGAVRDELLGIAVADRDWVVVGATPEGMTAAGFKAVGRDFPVFLHPATHEEYALARTERKSGRGYKGFTVYAAPEVTLEQDLARRDLTINAMARDPGGALIDPFGGARDLREGVLRHVSEAFAEDPVRILRVARFAARFGFRIAAETLALMRRMVEAGEVEHLVPERVWQELARGLGEAHPEQMLAALERCGALERLLPGIRPDVETLARAAAGGAPLTVRFALLTWNAEAAAVAALCERLRVPNAERELARLGSRLRTAWREAGAAPPKRLLALLKATDALRRPERFRELLAAARFAEPGPAMASACARLERSLAAAAAVDAAAIAGAAATRADIAARLEAARVQAIATALGD